MLDLDTLKHLGDCMRVDTFAEQEPNYYLEDLASQADESVEEKRETNPFAWSQFIR